MSENTSDFFEELDDSDMEVPQDGRDGQPLKKALPMNQKHWKLTIRYETKMSCSAIPWGPPLSLASTPSP